MSNKTWIEIAAADALAPGQMQRILAGGKKLLLCNADGKLHVVNEMCSHEDFSLFFGCIQEGKIKCSLHGSYFDLETGQPLNEPADEPICTYPLKIEGKQVFIQLD